MSKEIRPFGSLKETKTASHLTSDNRI